jgi:hypothetical protein
MTTTQKTHAVGDQVTFSAPNGMRVSGRIVLLNIESVDGTELVESDMPCHVVLTSEEPAVWAVPAEWIV